MEQTKTKRSYRRDREIANALKLANFDLAHAASILRISVKALHERLDRKPIIWASLGVLIQPGIFGWGHRQIHALFLTHPGWNNEVYRNAFDIFSQQPEHMSGNRKDQIALAIGSTLGITRQQAYELISWRWSMQQIAKRASLELCQRQHAQWQTTRKKRVKWRRRSKVLSKAHPPGV
jgi:hypothetical protein